MAASPGLGGTTASGPYFPRTSILKRTTPLPLRRASTVRTAPPTDRFEYLNRAPGTTVHPIASSTKV
jgi:hypothetical protein